MRTIVLGETRFVGRAVVDELLAAGHEVLVVHRGQHEPEGLPDVPLIDDLDRQRMLMSALQTLADIEGRNAASIVRDLRAAASDLVEFCVIA